MGAMKAKAYSTYILRFAFAVLILSFACLSLLVAIPQASAQPAFQNLEDTKTPTPPKPSYKGNKCNQRQVQIQSWFNEYVDKTANNKLCGRLIWIYDEANDKYLPGLEPCQGPGSPFIFKQRPDRLLEYYDLRGVKVGSGTVIYSEQYGCVGKYITGFMTYYEMTACSDCGRTTPLAPGGEIIFFPTPTSSSGQPLFFPTNTPPPAQSPIPLIPPSATPTATPTATNQPSPTGSLTPQPAALIEEPTQTLPPRMANLLRPEQFDETLDPAPNMLLTVAVPAAILAAICMLAALVVMRAVRRR